MSKRGMEFQGGSERYGGGDPREIPAEPPRQATAAQMARRKIATIKRPSRSTSPSKAMPSFGGFGQQQPATESQPAPASAPSGFAFGQTAANGTNGASQPAGFAFGQTQPASNGGFSFGQQQGSSSNTFTFGQQSSAQSGGFSFSAGGAVSFPPANSSNPFSSANGQAGVGSGFSGSIFNVPGSKTASQETQGVQNGFSFGSTNASTAPSTPSNSFNSSDADKKEIEQREPYMTSEQQKRVEEIVGQHLPDSPTSYQKAPLELLPQATLTQLAQYVRSLPSPSLGSPKVAASLFIKPYRAKSKKSWVTDAERDELRNAAPTLTPDQQSRLAQIAKDNVEPLRLKSDSDLPSFEFLPNDVQREMLEFVRNPAGTRASTPANPTNPFNFSASTTSQPKPAENPPSEQPKANPFATVKSTSASPATSPAPSTPFSFGPLKTAAPAQSPLPSFTFAKTTPAQQIETAAEETSTPATSNVTTTKPNPFAAVARPPSASPTPAPTAAQPSKPLSASKNTDSGGSGFKFTPFQSTSASSSIPDTSTTPAKSSFSFDSISKTPGPPTNLFNASSAPAPPATAPTQKSRPTFGFNAAEAPAQPVFQTLSSKSSSVHSQVDSKQGQAVPLPKTYLLESNDSLVTLVAKTGLLNASFRNHMKQLEVHADWSAPVGYYLQELGKLKMAIKKKELADAAPVRTTQNSAAPSTSGSTGWSPAATGQAPAAQSLPPQLTGKRPAEASTILNESKVEDSPAKRQKATPGFQISSPSKPLSNTANIFDSILSSPDKTKDATSPPKSSSKAPAAPVFKFQPSSGNGNAPQVGIGSNTASPFKVASGSTTNSAPSFSVPKFGGGGPASNFLSAFGAKAAKEAEKEKEKRKADDFDSDEDDEAEWERKDKEEQEEKKRKLAAQASKVMKMVDGKYVWVDKDAPDVASSAADTAKSSGPATAPANPFSFLAKPAATGGANVGKSQSQATDEDDEDTDEDEDGENQPPATNGSAQPATPAKSGGFFDRVSGKPQQDAETTAKTPLFNFSTASPAGDNTWKPESPIKFGQNDAAGSTTPTGSPAKPMFSFTNATPSQSPAATPKFNFGSASNEGNKASFFSTGASSSGFKFGNTTTSPSIFATSRPTSAAPSVFSSAPGSRATTPGATTADESTAANTDNDEDDAPAEEQKDLTALSAEERRTEEVLFEQKARCRKFVRGGDPAWENKGIGIVRLLKNKESGKHRVLMRLAPGGQIVINANLLKDKEVYASQGDKMVKVVFAEGQGELSTYILGFGKKESADELLAKVKAAE